MRSRVEVTARRRPLRRLRGSATQVSILDYSFLLAFLTHGSADWTSKLPMLSQGSTTSTSATESPTSAAASRHMPPPAVPHTISNASPKKSVFAGPTQSASRLNKPFGFLRTRRSLAFGEEQLGRFERDFVEIDEIGRGEFGRVMKARYKQGSQEVFAVKKSKRFEGVKHRSVFVFTSHCVFPPSSPPYVPS